MKHVLLSALSVSAIALSTCSFATASEINHNSTEYLQPDSSFLFKSAPLNEDSLIAASALKAYQQKYQSSKGFKSFAQSEDGAWGYATGKTSQEEANTQALQTCNKYLEESMSNYPCQLVNVAGKWLNDTQRGAEILKTLQKFTPEIPVDLRSLRSNTEADLLPDFHSEALAKRIWFHQNALSINKHYDAVRSSYGLISWAELGKVYPPAKTLLRYAANAHKQIILADPQKGNDSISEYESINSALGRDDNSLTMFKWLHQNHPEVAERNFWYFKALLVENKEYALYDEFVEPHSHYSQQASSYHYLVTRKGNKTNKPEDEWRLREETQRFINNAAELVAILVLNGKQETAQKIAGKARLDLDSADMENALADALEGKLPSR